MYSSLPWVTAYFFAIIGYRFYSREVTNMRAVRILLYVVILKVLLGLIFLVRGNYLIDSKIGTRVVYYDWITAYISLCFLGALIVLRFEKKYIIPTMLLVLVLQVLSLRRTVILALAVLLLLLFVKLKNQRIRIAFYTCLTFSILTISSTLNFGPSKAFVNGLAEGIKTFLGQGSDASIRGHLSDIEVGLQLLSEFGLSGLGDNISSISTLVVRNADAFYIHNEYLQQWASHGALGLVSTLILFFGCFVIALLKIDSSKNLIGLMARIYLIGLPIILFFSSDFTHSPRTQILTGLFIGVLLKEEKSIIRFNSGHDLKKIRI